MVQGVDNDSQKNCGSNVKESANLPKQSTGLFDA